MSPQVVRYLSDLRRVSGLSSSERDTALDVQNITSVDARKITGCVFLSRGRPTIRCTYRRITLSTALCVGAVIRKRAFSFVVYNAHIISTTVSVFPVPGGPQRQSSELFRASLMASLWLGFNLGTACQVCSDTWTDRGDEIPRIVPAMPQQASSRVSQYLTAPIMDLVVTNGPHFSRSHEHSAKYGGSECKHLKRARPVSEKTTKASIE